MVPDAGEPAETNVSVVEVGHPVPSVRSALARGESTPRDSTGLSRRRSGRGVVVMSTATAVGTYALVVLGSTVRVTNSGMGCPRWPLCYGRIGPVDQYHALLEQSHRYLVVLVTVGVLSTAIAARRSVGRRAACVPAAIATALVLVQAGLGALTVLAKNAPWTVAVHLAVGLVFFATTVVTAVVAVRSPRAAWSMRAVGRWGWAAIPITLAVVVGGTLVVAKGAGASCPSWPLCPASAPGVSAWQLLHRSLAGVAALSLVGLVRSRWRTEASSRAWRAGGLTLLGLFVAVAAFGAASALSQAAAGWQDAHLALVALTWGLLVALVTALATSAPRVGLPGIERTVT